MRNLMTKILFYTIIALLTFAAVFMLLPRPQPLPTLHDYLRARIAGFRSGDAMHPGPVLPIAEGHVAFPLEWPRKYAYMGRPPIPGDHYDLVLEKERAEGRYETVITDLLLVRVNLTEPVGFVMTFSVPKTATDMIAVAQKMGTVVPRFRWPPDYDSKKEEDEGKKETSEKH